MDNVKDSFLLKHDYKDVFAELEPAQAYQLLMAIFAYEESQTVPDFTGELKFAWIPIRQDLDKNREKYEETCRKRSTAGSQGGRGHKKEESQESKKSNCYDEKQKKQLLYDKAKKAKKADSDCDCECDSDLERENTTTTGAREPDDDTDTGDLVMAKYQVVQRYTELFGKPSEAHRRELLAAVDERGFTAPYECVSRAGQRDPPPDEPMAYIRKLLVNYGEPDASVSCADTG